ncbi:unnamed protein product [Urochloa humidicola]
MGKDSRRLAKKESRQHRWIAMACARDATAPPRTTILDVPNDLIELVLLRVRTPVCLFRAAATCMAWRRVVASAGFLHRFRAIHGPRLLLGHYCINTKDMEHSTAVFIPSPPRPAKHLRQRLSLDFIPDHSPYTYTHEQVLIDSRGGLLAFVQGNWDAVVCDPWTRQYKQLHFPWGEDDDCSYYFIGAFLLAAAADDDASSGSPMSSFMLLCAYLVLDYTHDTLEAHSYIFSATQDCWLEPPAGFDTGPRGHWTSKWSCRAGGSIFWFDHDGYVLTLDENTSEFSTFKLPAAPDDDYKYSRAYLLYHNHNIRVVCGGAESAVRIVCVADDNLEVLTRVRGASECTVERRVGLCQLANIEDRPDRSWRFVDTDTDTTPAALLEMGAFSQSSTLFFSLDVETMKLQRLDNKTAGSAARMFPYEIPWPQTIGACL